ncbi:MAG: PAS domain S-box protein [Deltaproteobacteria bacterium]|nr:PAS domain S-box protein [Deltaproteobacteria bacterium]
MLNRRTEAETPCVVFLIMLTALITQFWLPAPANTQTQNPLQGKNILILNPFESNIPAFQLTSQGLSAALQSGGIEIRNQFYEHLDMRRNTLPENRRLLVELMRQRYGQRKIDFIITLYPEALEFLLDDGQGVFSDAPVLALYLPRGFKVPDLMRRIVVHQVIPDFKRTIEIALKLVPKAERVYLVGGSHPLDRWLENVARQDFKTWEGRLEFHYLTDLPLEDILAVVSTAPSDSIVFITTFARDVTGKYQTTLAVCRQLARVSTAPIFGSLDILIGHGIVGGSVLSFESIGKKAGETMLDMLRGARYAEDTPLALEVPQLNMFDWQQLKHWKLSESALPEGSILLHKETTLWDFMYYAISASVFIVAQSVLIAGLWMQKRRRRSAEEALRHKTEEMDQFFNVTLDLLCIANTDGYFLRLNPAWNRILGHSREELTSQRFLDFVHPEDLDRTRKAVSALASQQEISLFENRYRCKDGTYRWLEWAAAPAGKLILAAARDITERKQVKRQMEERLEFESLISSLSAGFVNLPHDHIDSEIHKAIRSIVGFFNVDRCTIGLFSQDATQYVRVFEYHLPDVEPGPESLSKDQAPWYLEQLIQGKMVVINRVEDLPPEATNERRLCRVKGMKSLLSVPLPSGGKILGSCVLVSTHAERAWPEELLQRFQLITEVFANTLQRKQAIEASIERERILSQNEADLRRLAGRLIFAQEEERSRLARELHDDLAQRLAVLAMDVGRLKREVLFAPAAVEKKIRDVTRDVVGISQDVHNLSRQLHPSILDDLGLVQAIEAECAGFSRREGVDIAFHHENVSAVIPKDTSLSLYRIIQEGLRNISKHACANHVSVSLKGVDHDILLSVRDDGIGFDAGEVKNKPGLGLSSMRERVKLMQGELSIESRVEKGTVITVRVPVTGERE